MKTVRNFGLACFAMFVILVMWHLITWRDLRASFLAGFHDGDGITEAAAAQIKPGMFASDVERLFGCPEADYSKGKKPRTSAVFFHAGRESYSPRVWRNDRITVHVCFCDRTGRSTSMHFSVTKTE